METSLRELTGNIDIYLFDQLLKGTYDPCTTVLDAGCGTGRNLTYFLRNGYEVFGIDEHSGNLQQAIRLAQELAPAIPATNFQAVAIEDFSAEPASFDLVICSAVLHFAKDPAHFDRMLHALWRMLKPGGYFFARLASSIGIENRVEHLGDSRYRLPDGSTRFLVNEEQLMRYSEQLNGRLHEPIKTTNVQNLRCMTTWCMQKMIL